MANPLIERIRRQLHDHIWVDDTLRWLLDDILDVLEELDKKVEEKA
jgi:hypothetical protein